MQTSKESDMPLLMSKAEFEARAKREGWEPLTPHDEVWVNKKNGCSNMQQAADLMAMFVEMDAAARAQVTEAEVANA